MSSWTAGLRRDWHRFRGMTRGKCSYGDRHESVCMVGGEWLGESSRSFECDYAPTDPCPVCGGLGQVALKPGDAELESYDGETANAPATRPCRYPPCHGTGQVPGPHWPWRYPHPGPLSTREGAW